MNFISILLVCLSIAFAPKLACAQGLSAPAWFQRDIARSAAWLPTNIKKLGWEKVGLDYYSSLPHEVQQNLYDLGAPVWMLALSPQSPELQSEIFKQLKMAQDLAGTPARSPLAARAEQLLLLAGALQLPTPGDEQTGSSLGAEGCTATMTKYILSDLKLEYPEKMTWLPESIATSQSSSDILHFFKQLSRAPNSPIQVIEIPYHSLSVYDVAPGDLMVGQKPGGTHVFAWTRVPRAWGWSPASLMAIANTGLKPFGERMILAQEYLTDKMNDASEPLHNAHGPINSGSVVYTGDQVNLTDPRTNVYASENANFAIIRWLE